MKKQIFCAATVLTLAVCGSASADFINAKWILGPNQHPDGLHTTFQLVLQFDNPGDQISAINGVPGANSIDFWTIGGTDLYNQALFTGTPFNDFPSGGALGGELYDSYVTIGQTSFPSNTQFTPDFLGDWGGAPPPVQVIMGNSFSEDDGAWFFFGAPPVVGDLPDAIDGNDMSDIVIAQFTVDAGENIHFNANVAWIDEQGSHNTPFDPFPAPGALVLFGIAGLVGVRRRRG